MKPTIGELLFSIGIVILVIGSAMAEYWG